MSDDQIRWHLDELRRLTQTEDADDPYTAEEIRETLSISLLGSSAYEDDEEGWEIYAAVGTVGDVIITKPYKLRELILSELSSVHPGDYRDLADYLRSIADSIDAKAPNPAAEGGRPKKVRT